jgi:hypothetical protein
MIKVYKSPYVNGEPLEYMVSSTDGVIPIGAMAKQTSTAVGLGSADASTYLYQGSARYFITMQATTGSTAKEYCVQPIRPDVLYIVNHASSEAVVGTTVQGYNATVSSSGGCLAGTTGQFKISKVFNTSDTQAQYFLGHFLLKSSTTI